MLTAIASARRVLPYNGVMLNRRSFCGAAVAAAIISSRAAFAASEYDLLIRGGRVLDPGSKVDGLLDVAIRDGKIVALRAGLPASAAAEVIDATGRLVVPGLIDVHVHARDAALPPAEFLATGVTTMVDAGSRGADNIDQIVAIAQAAPNRMRLLLNIGRLGNNPSGRAEFLDGVEQADVEKAKAAVIKHRQWIIGMKARLSRGIAADHDLVVLKRAIEVADAARLPLMIHIGDTASTLPAILALLRPGDIVTHMYAPTPNTLLDARGRVLPEVRAARRRGIRFDFSNGLNEHWEWSVAEKSLAQGFAPDTIATDLTVAGRTEQVLDLPNVMSKMLLLGMPLKDVLACVTVNAAKTFRELNALGSLAVGTAADVTILELGTGGYEFIDNYKNRRNGPQRLLTRGVVMGGKSVA
jgi:dihydroorotase